MAEKAVCSALPRLSDLLAGEVAPMEDDGAKDAAAGDRAAPTPPKNGPHNLLINSVSVADCSIFLPLLWLVTRFVYFRPGL